MKMKKGNPERLPRLLLRPEVLGAGALVDRSELRQQLGERHLGVGGEDLDLAAVDVECQHCRLAAGLLDLGVHGVHVLPGAGGAAVDLHAVAVHLQRVVRHDVVRDHADALGGGRQSRGCERSEQNRLLRLHFLFLSDV